VAASPNRPKHSELAGHLAAFRSVFLAVGGFSFAVNLLMLAPAIYMLQVYDRVLSSRNEATLAMLSLILVGLFLLEAGLELVRARVLIRASAALDVRLSPRVFDASFQHALSARSANPGSALADLTNIRQFVTGKGLFAFFDAPWTPIYVLAILLLHPWLGLFALLAALLLLALAWINQRATGSLLGEAGKRAEAAQNYAASQLRNAEAIEAMGMLANLRRRWLERQYATLASQAAASERNAWVGAATRLTRMTLQSGILGVGALLVLADQMSPGGMVAASILLARALSPVDLAIGTWRSFVSARSAYGRLDALLDAHPLRGEKTALPRPEGFVLADNLVVAAPGTRTPVIKGIKFGASPGMLVAVIGPSASGKSTLARALVGIWAPMAGSVRLDNADIHKWNKDELGPWLGYLPQDVELFEGTIAENIARFGQPDAEQIIAAARKAGVHDMVLHLPEGYDTPIGEDGIMLSGGQRQRIALARALYGDPALIVLDEPNANLDDAGDAALLEALRAMKAEKRTVFVVTHRMNLVQLADAVLVLSNGSIEAYGPRETVMQSLKRRVTPGASRVKALAGEEAA
jgi:ATP-binding cassette subfamily C exporter for protease/lipase